MIQRNKKITLSKEDVFIMAFSLYYIQAFLRTTMFVNSLPNIFFSIMKFSSFFLVLTKILFMDKYSSKKIIRIISITCLFIFSTFFSSYRVLMEYLIFILGANEVSLRKVVKTYLVIGILLLIVTIICAKLGIIENLIYQREGKKRESFGVCYPTDFVAHILFICMAFMYLKGKNMRWYNYLIITLIAGITYYLCDTRLDSGCMILAAVLDFIYNKNLIKFDMKFVKYGLIFSYIICATISIYLSVNYNKYSNFYKEVDKLLSSRLRIGNMMYNDYGVKLLGQQIDDHGWGGSLEFKYDKYNYIDCSYLRVLLKYGLVIFSIVMIANFVISIKLYKDGNYLELIIFTLIAMNSIIAQHLIDFSYNFLLLIYFSQINESLEGSKKENEI